MIIVTALIVLPPHALALPSGARVVDGRVTISSPAGSRLNIRQGSAAAIVDWQHFSIGSGETVHIDQPTAQSALLNRVVSGDPSSLLGQLQANGKVFLINPNGVVVGRHARIDVGSFLATTSQISNRAFLVGGKLAFAGASKAGIVNLGLIRAESGNVILVGRRVKNAGTVDAPRGTAALVAATAFVYEPANDSVITIAAGKVSHAGGTGVSNSGLIKAANAQLSAVGHNVYALAVNQTGVIRATGVKRADGRILLTTDGGAIDVSGSLSAHRADGSGGQVFVGGGDHGRNAAIADAASTRVSASAVIDVAANSAKGNGGHVVVWSNGQTDFAGRIDGQGGAKGGNGGYAEVSGKRRLNFNGTVDLTAAMGRTGELLLDPDYAVISTATDNQANGVFNNSVLAASLASANVIIDTSTYGNGTSTSQYGTIHVNAPVTWTSANTLTLQSGNDINVDANLTGGTGSGIVFSLGVGAAGVNTTGILTVSSKATVSTGTVTIEQNTAANPPQAGNLPPVGNSMRTLGSVAFNGILKATTLDLALNQGGVENAVSINNAANAFSKFLTETSPTGTIGGSLDAVNGAGDLIFNGSVTSIGAFGAGASTITLTTPGNLTLASGALVENETGGNVTLASTSGSFANQAGSNTIAATNGGRILVYSDAPANTTLDGLSLTPVYNKTYAGNPPSGITETGNRILYSLAPVLTLTADSLSRYYGGANPTLTYTVTGLVGGDTAAQAFSGTPTLSTTATKSANQGQYTIAIAKNTVVASDYNYGIQFANGTLTVNPAPLTITADNQSKTVGNPNPTLTATFTGLVNGDTSANFPGLGIVTTATTASPTGTYPITVSGATNANYTIKFVNGVLTVNAQPILTVTADDLIKIYGAANPTLTDTITGFNPGDNASIISGLTLTTTATAGSSVGSYAIVPSGGSAAGYTFKYIDGTLTIKPAKLLITVDNANRFYGAANPAFGVAYSGFVNGDNANVVSGLRLSTGAMASSNVGQYAITASGATAANYTISTAPGTLTVKAEPLSIDIANASKVYADNNPAFSAVANGLVLGQRLSQLGTLNLATGASQLSSVGSYPITGSLSSPTSLAGNYTISINGGTLAITQRPVSVTASSASRLYGDANPAFTASISGTNPPGTTDLNLLNLAGLAVTSAATAASNVGNYPVTASGLDATNPNFSINYVNGVLTVNPAPVTLTANDASRQYGDANPTFTGVVSGLKQGDTAASVLTSEVFTTPATTGSNVGSYAIAPSARVIDSNYTVNYQQGKLTVNPAPLFVAPTATVRYYGDANPKPGLVAQGLRNGDTSAVITAYFTVNAGPGANVGNYVNSIVSAHAYNYTLTLGTSTLTVEPRPLTIKANDVSRLYGDANPAFSATYTGLASFDTPLAISGLTLTTKATQSSGVQQLAITPSGASNPNYAITLVPGTLTIKPAPLDFGVGNFFKVYGQAVPTVTPSLISGLELSDTYADLGVSVAGPAADANVGTYPLVVKVSDPNYTVAQGTGSLQITPAPIDVTVGNVSRVYGDTNPPGSSVPLTVTGLAYGQSAHQALSIDYGVDATANAGNYPITAVLNTKNYQIARLVFGNLDVLKRNIALKPENVTRYYGDPSPAYKILVAGDGLAPFDKISSVAYTNLIGYDSAIISALPGPKTDVGSHELFVKLTGNPNYNVAMAPGIFTILPRPITLTLTDTTIVGSSSLKSANVASLGFKTTATNLAAGDTVASVFPYLTYELSTQDPTDPVQTADTIASFKIPSVFSDSAFMAAYPPTISNPGGGSSSGGTVYTFQPITVTNLPGTVTGSKNSIITIYGSISLADLSAQLTGKGAGGSLAPVIEYVRPKGYNNPDYVVTAVHNGTVTFKPDPVVVARLEQAQKEAAAKAQERANMKAFFHPPGGLGAFGLPGAAMPAVLQAIIDQVDAQYAANKGHSSLEAAIEKMLGHAEGTRLTKADIYAFWVGIEADPTKKAIIMPAVMRYVSKLASESPQSYSPADKALASVINAHLAAARDNLASSVKAQYNDWLAKQKSSGAASNMTNLFGNDVPYAQFLKQGAAQVMDSLVQSQVAGVAKMGATFGASGATAVATGIGVANNVARIMPHTSVVYNAGRLRAVADSRAAKIAEMGRTAPATSDEVGTGSDAIAMSGDTAIDPAAAAAEVAGEAVAEAGATMGTTVAAIAVGAVVLSIQRGVQVVNNEQQKKIYNMITDTSKSPPTLGNMNLNTTKGNTTKKVQATVNKTLLDAAVTSLLFGS